MSQWDIPKMLDLAAAGIGQYLAEAKSSGALNDQLYDEAVAHTFPTLKRWLSDPDVDRISPSLRSGVCSAIDAGRWEDIVNAFHRPVRFGTGGIRAMMAFDRESIARLKAEGVGAPILKGVNTINDLLLLLTSAGVARYGREQTPDRFDKIVVGYDSRIRGADFAKLVAELFLYYDYTVFFFDEACPYPEVTFAIPDESIKADLGVFISASHNDYRYNGYKLSCANGSQFDVESRTRMYEDFIANAQFSDIAMLPLEQAPPGRLFFLGGEEPVEGFDYAGRQDCLINMHEKHREHVKSFLLTPDLAQRQDEAADPLNIAYCAFHGAGRRAVPRLLREVGFSEIQIITRNGLNDLDGLFPSFCSDPGREQQPDPGDPRAAEIAVGAFNAEYPGEFEDVDILIGTDPDADRCGVVVKVPEEQRALHGDRDYYLLAADDVWSLLLWYRLEREIEAYGEVRDADKKFVVISHVTSDSMTRLALKYGLGVVKSWVGFPTMAAATNEFWESNDLEGLCELVDGRNKTYSDICHPLMSECLGMESGRRSINVAAMEQSNGFSILGGRPPDKNSLGVNGHVRDKDGTFAALLVAEVAAWAKEQGKTLIELIDEHVYLDPDVGLFVGAYEPDPLDGEYPGIEGDRIKNAILRRALGYFQLALAGDLEIAGRPVVSACIFRTGKYDAIYPPSYDYHFPDEGVRFFFDADRRNHVTVRPSGTGNSLRFYLQLHSDVAEADLLTKKELLRNEAAGIMTDIRRLLKAPRR